MVPQASLRKENPIFQPEAAQTIRATILTSFDGVSTRSPRDEIADLGEVAAKCATELGLRADPRRRRDWKRAIRADQGAAAEHLHAAFDELAALTDGGAAEAADLDVGLSLVAVIGRQLESHQRENAIAVTILSVGSGDPRS